MFFLVCSGAIVGNACAPIGDLSHSMVSGASGPVGVSAQGRAGEGSNRVIAGATDPGKQRKLE